MEKYYFLTSVGTYTPFGLFLGYALKNAYESHTLWQAALVVVTLSALALVKFFIGKSSFQLTHRDFQRAQSNHDGKCSRCGTISEPSEQFSRFCRTPFLMDRDPETGNIFEKIEDFQSKEHNNNEAITFVRLAEMRLKGLLPCVVTGTQPTFD